MTVLVEKGHVEPISDMQRHMAICEQICEQFRLTDSRCHVIVVPTMKITFNDKMMRDLELKPDEPRRQLWDARERGLYLVLGRRGGTYFVAVNDNNKRMTEPLGELGKITVTEARKRAAAVKGRISEGKLTPVQIIKLSLTGPTVQEALDSYLAYLTNVGRTSGKRVADEMKRHLADWLPRPLREINWRDCDERHKLLTQRGKHVANRVLNNFGTIWNRVTLVQRRTDATWPSSPTQGISWHRDGQPDFESRRREPIPLSQLPDWWTAVHQIKSDRRRNYHLLVMFTGIRRNDAMTMLWPHVNLTDATIETQVFHPGKGRMIPIALHAGCMIRPNPKGGFRKAFSVPLPRFLIDLLIKQRAAHTDDDDGWIFPGYAAKTTECHDCAAIGRPAHVAGQLSHMRDARESHIIDHTTLRPGEGAWSPHRCRDGYVTAQESINMPVGIGGALVNHSYRNQTVTDGYRRPSTEDLREWQEKLCSYLMTKMQPPSEVQTPQVQTPPVLQMLPEIKAAA